MSFNDDIKKFKRKTEGAALDVFMGTGLEMFGRIVKRTPVGNPSIWQSNAPSGYVGGRARSNWQVQINSKPSGVIDSTGGPPTPSLQTLKLGDSIYVLNNLPYIIPLEHGHSSQAPAGMVKVTVSEFPRIVVSNI